MKEKLNRKEKIFLVVSLFYIIYTIFPLFADLTGIPVYIPALFVVLVLGILFPNVFKTEPFKWFFVYILSLALYSLVGKPIHINGLTQKWGVNKIPHFFLLFLHYRQQ